MRFFFFLALGLVFSSSHIQAQSTEDSIKYVINELFNGMREANKEKVRGVFLDSAIMHTFGVNREGVTIIRKETVDRFIESIGNYKEGEMDEKIRFEQILVDAPMAMVWTPYKFYFRKNFTHCGVNLFTMVRQQGVWKIQNITDTRYRGKCTF
jgi:hypothetical protein